MISIRVISENSKTILNCEYKGDINTLLREISVIHGDVARRFEANGQSYEEGSFCSEFCFNSPCEKEEKRPPIKKEEIQCR